MDGTPAGPGRPRPVPAARLTDEARRLARRLTGVNAAWFVAMPPGAARTREQVLRALVDELARLGAEGGTGAPAGAVPQRLGVHALADQLTVLAADLAGLPPAAGRPGGPVSRAARAVTACYDALWPPAR